MNQYEILDLFIRMMASGIILGMIHVAIFHMPKWE